jgi:hypothetical protein
MPFTISHAAIVAPLQPLVRRWRLPLSALAVGAMVPDFEYFVHLRPLALWSHSLVGLLTFCLPTGLVVVSIWEFVMRDAVASFLTGGETWSREPRSARWWALAVIAILLGAASHIVWDGLTHRNGWGEQMLPQIGATAVAMRGRPLTWGVLLDYASTVVGGALVCAWLAFVVRRDGARDVWAQPGWRWPVLMWIVGGGLVFGYWNGSRSPAATDYWSGELWLARAAVGAMSGFGVALLAFCVFYRITQSGGRTL